MTNQAPDGRARRNITTAKGNAASSCLSDDAVNDPAFMDAFEKLIDTASEQLKRETP